MLYEFCAENESFVFNGKNFKIYKSPEKSEQSKPIPLRNNIPSIRTLALTICNYCNLACSYCYANQGNWDAPGEKMEIETANASVDLLVKEVKRSQTKLATLSFFGGEPLLRFDFIKKIVEYAEKRDPDINWRFAIVSNGTLFNNKRWEYFQRKKFIVSLSLDGDEKQHDSVRIYPNSKGSYSTLIEKTKPFIGKTPILVRATISDHNTNVLKAIKSIRLHGFSRISYEIDNNMSKEGFQNFLLHSEELFQWYLSQIKIGNYFDFRNLTRVLAPILLKMRSKSHCNAGIGYMAVSADGQLYPCHRFIGENELSLGDVRFLNTKQIEDQVNKFDTSLKKGPQERHEECKECSFAFLCGGNCLYQSYINNNDLLSIVDRCCCFKRHTFDQVIRLICELKGPDLNKYVDFLKKLWQKENRLVT